MISNIFFIHFNYGILFSLTFYREFAKDWDSVEMSLHFTTLLAARHVWDNKVKKVLKQIKQRGFNLILTEVFSILFISSQFAIVC